jgi:hypothetical protein
LVPQPEGKTKIEDVSEQGAEENLKDRKWQGRRDMNNEELHDVYSSSKVNRITK